MTPSPDTRLVESCSTLGVARLEIDASGRMPWVKRAAGLWTWQIHPDWLHLFDREACPDWLNLASWPGACLVKANDGREVWRLEVAKRLVFVKICRPARRWARMRRLLFGSDAAREARCAEYAAGSEIATVSPVAWAEASRDGRKPTSILVTAGVRDCLPLNDAWAGLSNSGQLTRAARDAIIDRVARLLARAHQGGFEHLDLHAGNVLLDPTPEGGYRALFVDLNNVRVGRPISDASVARNLAQFNQWFRSNAPVSDRIRFLDRYLHWRDLLRSNTPCVRSLGCDRRGLLRLLERAAHAHAEALYAKRDRRAMRTGRYFARLRLRDGWRAHVFLEAKHPLPGSAVSRLRFTPEQWSEWLSNPLEWAKPSDRRRLIKDSATATVCRAELRLPDGPLEVICKRSTPRKLLKRVQNLFRSSRPMLTWRRAQALLNRQIPTARPLAVLERRCGPCTIDSLLLTEYIQNAHDLDTLLTVTMRDMPPEAQRRLKKEVSSALVAVVRRLLDRGFVHRDFKAPNIIVQYDAAAGQAPRVLLIDLDGVKRARRGASADVRMLMRLNVSLDHCRRVTRTDRLRFLRSYLQRIGAPRKDWKVFWRQVEQLSEHKRIARSRSQERKFRKYGRF